MEISLRLARHVANTDYDHLPDEARLAAKRSLVDALGVTLAAGTLEPACRPFVELALARGGEPESSVFGFGTRVPAASAAFANGSLAHALDFEDAHDGARVHPYAATVPAALALAQARGNVSGRDLLTALALGSDLVCRLGLALQDDPIERGWYVPPILGAFGATAAAGRLLQLSAEELVDAFSLTLCQATCSAELTHSPDSVVRAIRDAFAAQTGVLSAQLAAKGVRGFEEPFEGKAGLFQLYAPRSHDFEALTDALGERFEGAFVSYKPWPACRGTHPFIEATLQMIGEHRLSSSDIRYIRLRIGTLKVTQRLCEPPATKRRPRTAIDAKFSLPFAVAVAAVHGDVALDHFSSHGLADPAVLTLADKVNYEVDAEFGTTRGSVEMETARGVFRADTPVSAYGSPDNPMSTEALRAKFLHCAAYARNPIEPEHLDLFLERAFRLEDTRDIDEAISLLDGSEDTSKATAEVKDGDAGAR